MLHQLTLLNLSTDCQFSLSYSYPLCSTGNTTNLQHYYRTKPLSVLTSWSYSKKTLKLGSILRLGWEASRARKTSCMATVFLNVAKYSLHRRHPLRQAWKTNFPFATHASSSAFIFWNSDLVIVPSAWPSLNNFSLDSSKSGRGGGGGIYHTKFDKFNSFTHTKWLKAWPKCQHSRHFQNSDHAATQIPREDVRHWNHPSWSQKGSSIDTKKVSILDWDLAHAQNVLPLCAPWIWPYLVHWAHRKCLPSASYL